MSNHRILKYTRQFKDDAPTTEKFTQAQATSVNTPLETDGICIEKAIELISLWNTQGQRHGYKYSLPFIAARMTQPELEI